MAEPAQPRLSARALVVHDGALLLVNATPDKGDGKWCTPGGGVEAGDHLKANIVREVMEETGLVIEVGDLAVVYEFFDRAKKFHQVDLFFHATTAGRDFPAGWTDIADVVAHRGFFTMGEIAAMDVFPRFLREGGWNDPARQDIIYRGYEDK